MDGLFSQFQSLLGGSSSGSSGRRTTTTTPRPAEARAQFLETFERYEREDPNVIIQALQNPNTRAEMIVGTFPSKVMFVPSPCSTKGAAGTARGPLSER